MAEHTKIALIINVKTSKYICDNVGNDTRSWSVLSPLRMQSHSQLPNMNNSMNTRMESIEAQGIRIPTSIG